MKITNLAAWWGAIIATFLLLWDIYKYRHSGPIIKIDASPNMEAIGKIPNNIKNKKYISVEVTNIGDRNTTITHLIMFHYKSLFRKIMKKKDKNMFIPTPALFPPPLPHILKTGERWLGGIEQTNELEEMSRNGYLYCGIYHSVEKKSIVQRVIIHKNPSSILETK